MLGEAKRRVRAAGPTYSPIVSLILLHKTYLNLPKVTLDKLVFTDNAVGRNVVEGVGYPKISRLSLDRPGFPVQNGDKLLRI
jgi:hypothetical protein